MHCEGAGDCAAGWGDDEFLQVLNSMTMSLSATVWPQF